MVRHPLVGYLIWALLFGALFAGEGLSLARVAQDSSSSSGATAFGHGDDEDPDRDPR